LEVVIVVVAAAFVSLLTSMAGVSGAFLLWSQHFSKGKGLVEHGTGIVKVLKVDKRVECEFLGHVYSFNAISVVATSFAVGIIGGAYGIGGGAPLAPVYASVFSLPIYTTAGAILPTAFISSTFGVVSYYAMGHPPNWPLGLSLGVGGLVGMCQREY